MVQGKLLTTSYRLLCKVIVCPPAVNVAWYNRLRR